MKVAVTGSSGLLGSALADGFTKGHEVLRLTRALADVSKAEQIRKVVRNFRPDVVIHSAALRDPDQCELQKDFANAVNVEGTRNVVRAADEVGAAVAYISTDAVFNGQKASPYTEEDPPAPVSFYARTKLRGEDITRQQKESWIFRMPVLFGPGPNSSLAAGLRALREGREYAVASDQVGCVSHTEDAAEKIREVIEARAFGLFHLANPGAVSRLELARRAASLAGLDPERVMGRTIAEMKRPGPRPKYVVMELAELRNRGFALPRPWEEALSDYIFWLKRAEAWT
ncbi:MAG: SDR family oxidoreductase [Terriglobales bacterium]